jgi:alpha-ribazole phosphatase
LEKTIYFIRHGESVANAGGITMENKKIPLSSKGLVQAQSVVENFKIMPSQILVSEYLRTHQTAKPFCCRNNSEYQVCTELNEFSIISHELIEGMTGTQRRPIADAFWSEGDVNKRMGIEADTFNEFSERVNGFIAGMSQLSNGTVLFGHGIWFGMLLWKLMGFAANDQQSMIGFRRFQNGLPISNCIIYRLHSVNDRNWSVYVHNV